MHFGNAIIKNTTVYTFQSIIEFLSQYILNNMPIKLPVVSKTSGLGLLNITLTLSSHFINFLLPRAMFVFRSNKL